MRDPQRKLIKGAQSVCIFCALCAGLASTSLAQTIIHRFTGPNGSTPWSPPVEGLDTFLYGTTRGGGANEEGTVYKLTPEGKQAWVYSFCAVSGCPDGNTPLAGLVQGLDGGLFGTTWTGGAADAGTAFTISTGRKFTTLNSLCEETNCADGA
jgi:uncharacterized repeat protein (TIGR03803 family)